MTKLIEGFSHHTIDEKGTVINLKTNNQKSQWIGANGYYHVDIQEYGTPKKVAVHRLLAISFIPNPKNKRTVNHIDGNKLNNDLSNLEWATDSENVKHAHDTGLQPYQRNYSLEEYDNILETRFLVGESITDISKTINQSLTQLSLHLHEAAIRLGILDKYEQELKNQKAARAKSSGKTRRQAITIHMLDKNTKEILQTFSCVSEARDFLKVKSCGPISNALSDKQKSAYGYFWVKL